MGMNLTRVSKNSACDQYVSVQALHSTGGIASLHKPVQVVAQVYFTLITRCAHVSRHKTHTELSSHP